MIKMTHDITIIVVTYNRLNYLKQTVNSILAQSVGFRELLIICDGHQEDINAYITSLNNPIISYHSVIHCGYPARARNLGLELAKGKYIAFCDDDDLWLPTKIEEQMAVLNNDPSIGLCCTNRDIIDSVSQSIEVHGLRWIPAKHDTHSLVLTNFISYSSVIIKKEVIDKAGTFVDHIKFKAIEDYHLWLRISLFTRLYFLNKPLIKYRIHSTNISDRLSDGAKKNMLLYNDLFSRYKFRLTDRLKARTVVYTKYLLYKLTGK